VRSGLFREVPAFTALEARIAALSTEQDSQLKFNGSSRTKAPPEFGGFLTRIGT
jgi:hypothetical protein